MIYTINLSISNNAMVLSEDFSEDLSLGVIEVKVTKNSFIKNNLPIYNQYQLFFEIKDTLYEYLFSYQSKLHLQIYTGGTLVVETYLIPITVEMINFDDTTRKMMINCVAIGLIPWRLNTEENLDGISEAFTRDHPFTPWSLYYEGLLGFMEKSFGSIRKINLADDKTKNTTLINEGLMLGSEQDRLLDNYDNMMMILQKYIPTIGVSLYSIDDFIPIVEGKPKSYIRFLNDELITSVPNYNKRNISNNTTTNYDVSNVQFLNITDEYNAFSFYKVNKSLKLIYGYSGTSLTNLEKINVYKFSENQLDFSPGANPYWTRIGPYIEKNLLDKHEKLLGFAKLINSENFYISPYIVNNTYDIGNYFSIMSKDKTISSLNYIYGQEIVFAMMQNQNLGDNIVNARSFTASCILKTFNATRLIDQIDQIIL